MRDRCTFLLGLVSLVFVASPCHGQSSYTPQSIHFSGAPAYSDVELASAVGLKTGQAYSSDELKWYAKRLMEIGIFDKVAYKFDGEKLTYTVSVSSQLYPIQIGSLPLEFTGDLDSRLRAKIPLYQGAVPQSGTLLEAVRHTFEEMLALEGVHSQVTAELVEDPATHSASAVRFNVAGHPVKIGSLKFEGVSEFLKPEFDHDAALTELTFDGEKSAAELERDIQAIYAGHGFAAAQVHAVRYGYPVTDEGVIRVPYKITVKEGRSYRLGTVTLAQDLPIDPAEVDKLMAARSTFMPESMFVANLISQVEMRLKGQGYANCRVTLAPQVDENKGVVNYKVEADLGTSARAAL